MKASKAHHITISNSKILDNIISLRKLWVSMNSKHKSLWINSFNPKESLILINRASAEKNLAPIGFTVQFFLSIGCSANCIMCEPQKPQKPGNSFNHIIKLLDYLEWPTVLNVDLVEGEPLIDKPGLLKFMKKCAEKKLGFSLVTNALSLTEDYIDLLATNGLTKIAISLDSDSEEAHDQIRGVKGSFRQIIKSIQYFKKKYPHVHVVISSVVMKINFKSIPKIIELANTLNVNTITFNSIINKGKNFDELILNEDDRVELHKIQHSKIIAQNKIPINWDPCTPLQKTGCLYRYHQLIVEEASSKIVFCSQYKIKEKLYLNKPLDQLFRDKIFQDYFLPENFPCIWEFENKSKHKFPFTISEADRCEYKLIEKWAK